MVGISGVMLRLYDYDYGFKLSWPPEIWLGKELFTVEPRFFFCLNMSFCFLSFGWCWSTICNERSPWINWIPFHRIINVNNPGTVAKARCSEHSETLSFFWDLHLHPMFGHLWWHLCVWLIDMFWTQHDIYIHTYIPTYNILISYIYIYMYIWFVNVDDMCFLAIPHNPIGTRSHCSGVLQDPTHAENSLRLRWSVLLVDASNVKENQLPWSPQEQRQEVGKDPSPRQRSSGSTGDGASQTWSIHTHCHCSTRPLIYTVFSD